MNARAAKSLVKAGFFSVYCDRSMLIVDFFIATSVPFVIQLLIWSRAVFPANELQGGVRVVRDLFVLRGCARFK